MEDYGRDKRWPLAQGSGSTVVPATFAIGLVLSLWIIWNNLATTLLLAAAALVWFLILFFFRDPNRTIVSEPGLVLGPGDGEIVEIVKLREDRYLRTESLRISLFLSITDVHVQRIPLEGTVIKVDHQPGKFVKAFQPEASDVNEYIATLLDTAYGPILVKQIAGILARRCVNYLKTGVVVESGDRFGLIRFGSRVDLFLPPSATMLAAVGDKVYGGVTKIARLETVCSE